ncbi:hypothetical protein [Psychroserpens sp.]
MKHLLLFAITIMFSNNIVSQTTFPPERIFIIASVENNTFKSLDYSLSDLSIESKISWILKLNSKDFNLVNPTIFNEIGKGWYLQYKFETLLYTGIYKEKLQLKDNLLIITESRSAMMAMASNCNKIIFTNNDDRCKCTNKKDTTLDSLLTYRLFSSLN